MFFFVLGLRTHLVYCSTGAHSKERNEPYQFSARDISNMKLIGEFRGLQGDSYCLLRSLWFAKGLVAYMLGTNF